jgi:hypothetical protein
MENINGLPDKLDVLYPGQGVQKAAAMEGKSVEELKIIIDNNLKANGDVPKYYPEEEKSPVEAVEKNTSAGLRLKPTVLSLSIVASIFYWIC